jgi:hypothetical protein
MAMSAIARGYLLHMSSIWHAHHSRIHGYYQHTTQISQLKKLSSSGYNGIVVGITDEPICCYLDD